MPEAPALPKVEIKPQEFPPQQPKPEKKPIDQKAKEILQKIQQSILGKKNPDTTFQEIVASPAEVQSDVQQESSPQAESKEVLRPANDVFYHTTHNSKVDSLKKSGLFSSTDQATIGESIGYSLFFPAREHFADRHGSISGDEVRAETPQDYSLTIWQNLDQSLVKMEDPHGAARHVGITTRAQADQIPEEFLKTSHPGEGFGSHRDPNQASRLNPDNLVATLPLTKTVREEILKDMVLAHAGIMQANTIEEKLLNVLKQEEQANPESVYLKPGTTMENLVHDITVSLERDLVKEVAKRAFDRALDKPQVEKQEVFPFSLNPSYRGEPVYALWVAQTYRENTNDPESAAELDRVIINLKQQIVTHGGDLDAIEESFTKNREAMKNGRKQTGSLALVDITNGWRFYSYNHTKDAAFSLVSELDIPTKLGESYTGARTSPEVIEAQGVIIVPT